MCEQMIKPVKSKETNIHVDNWLDCPQKASQTGCSMKYR